MKRVPQRTVLVAAASAIVLVALVFAAVRIAATSRPHAVREQMVTYTSFTTDLPENGVVQYPQIQTIASRIPGIIGRIFVKAGDHVSAGQLLAWIDSPEIVSDAQTSGEAYRSASAKAQSAGASSTSNLAQAEANVEAARARLEQARQDAENGSQSGLGYGETTAADQRAQAQANVETTGTALAEAQRLYNAYQNLYGNKAVSHDQLDQARAKYEQAKVAYDQARLQRSSLGTQLVRTRPVLQENLRSAQEGYADAQTELAAARAQSGGGDVAAAQAEAARASSEYSFAQQQADATRISAPYDATILSVAPEKNDPLRPLQPGDAVEPGQPLLSLAAGRTFIARIKIDEQDAIDVRIGQRAQISGEDFPGKVLSGRVVAISPIAERGDDPSGPRKVDAVVRIDRAPSFLRDGTSVDVDIITNDLRRTIAVPNDAIVRSGQDAFVYVVRRGVAYRQPIRAGLSNGATTIVDTGLHAGDLIVVRGAGDLSDGAAVSSLASTQRP